MWCTATSSDGVEHPSRSGTISLVECGRRGARPDIGHHGLLAQVTGQALRKLMFAARSGFVAVDGRQRAPPMLYTLKNRLASRA